MPGSARFPARLKRSLAWTRALHLLDAAGAGDFAAFLQAKPDERAPILEQITGRRSTV